MAMAGEQDDASADRTVTTAANSAVRANPGNHPPTPTGHPYADLVAELEHVRRCSTEPNPLDPAAVPPAAGSDAAVREHYLQAAVLRAQGRFHACLQDGVAKGLLDPDADLDIAVTLLTGSCYTCGVAGPAAAPDWAARVTALVWRACGGDVLRHTLPRRGLDV